MVQYNKIIDDMGKGRQTVRTATAHVALVNGVATALIAAPPFPFIIKRVSVGSSVATDFVDALEVIVLAPGTDLDTAPGSGNRLITPLASFADKKMHDQTLLALAQSKKVANSLVVIQMTNNGVLGTGLANVLVEYDSIGQTYGAYDGDNDSVGAYD